MAEAALARTCMPACQLAKCGRSPTTSCLKVPRVQLGNMLCLFWMCETPVQILYMCLGLNMCSYALPTSFSLHRATFVETCCSGLVLAQKMKENNFIHHQTHAWEKIQALFHFPKLSKFWPHQPRGIIKSLMLQLSLARCEGSVLQTNDSNHTQHCDQGGLWGNL